VGVAVAELGYRHNLGAGNLRRGRRTASIGVLVQDLRTVSAARSCERSRTAPALVASW